MTFSESQPPLDKPTTKFQVEELGYLLDELEHVQKLPLAQINCFEEFAQHSLFENLVAKHEQNPDTLDK